MTELQRAGAVNQTAFDAQYFQLICDETDAQNCEIYTTEIPGENTFLSGDVPTQFPALAFIDVTRSSVVTFLEGSEITTIAIKSLLLRLWKYEWNGSGYKTSESTSNLPVLISNGAEFKAGLPFGLGLFDLGLNLPPKAWLIAALLTGGGAAKSKGITRIALGSIAAVSAINYTYERTKL